MSYCEDFPCCGHEAGFCPDFDPETGEQLDMRCVCGASVVPLCRSLVPLRCARAARSVLSGKTAATAVEGLISLQ